MARRSTKADPPKEVKFTDFSPINVPIAAVRMELSALQADGFEEMPLDAFLLMIHRVVKEVKDG